MDLDVIIIIFKRLKSFSTFMHFTRGTTQYSIP